MLFAVNDLIKIMYISIKIIYISNINYLIKTPNCKGFKVLIKAPKLSRLTSSEVFSFSSSCKTGSKFSDKLLGLSN